MRASGISMAFVKRVGVVAVNDSVMQPRFCPLWHTAAEGEFAFKLDANGKRNENYDWRDMPPTAYKIPDAKDLA